MMANRYPYSVNSTHEDTMPQTRKPLQLRLPDDLKAWLKAEADRNGSSQNSEVIRALRAAQTAPQGE